MRKFQGRNNQTTTKEEDQTTETRPQQTHTKNILNQIKFLLEICKSQLDICIANYKLTLIINFMFLTVLSYSGCLYSPVDGLNKLIIYNNTRTQSICLANLFGVKLQNLFTLSVDLNRWLLCLRSVRVGKTIG